jgi:ADP-heptose:LPS heptosyltransferase
VHHWSDFIRQSLQAHPDAIALCVGGPDDVVSWERLKGTVPNGLHERLINAQGKTSFIGLMHLLNQVDVLIGADSAPLHIMDWLVREGLNPDGKSLALMGATHPQRTGPLHEGSTALTVDLPCMPCHKRVCPLGSLACMEMLTPQVVLNTLAQHLTHSPLEPDEEFISP